jgi:hypothetical protein
MKRRGLVRLAAALAAVMAVAGCRSLGPVDVRVSLPGVSPFERGAFTAIVITGLRDEAPFEEFQPGPAFEEALQAGLRRELRGKVDRVGRAQVRAIAGSDGAEVWKAAGAAEEPGTVYLAGSLRMTSDVRKALDKKALADGPFDLVGRLLAKRRWRLEAEIYVISAATGETLHHQVCDEFQDYAELDKPAEFAFSELSDRVLVRLYQVLCAKPSLEVRTLLQR